MGYESLIVRLLVYLVLLLPLLVKANVINYQITLAQPFTMLVAQVCFPQQVPKNLYNGQNDEDQWLIKSVGPNERPLVVKDNRMALTGIKSGQCIDYAVQLNAIEWRRDRIYRTGQDILIDNHLWLWQPRNLTADDQVNLHFVLPKGFNISTPWLAGDQPSQFRLTTTPYDWQSRIAIGQFTIAALAVANQTLQVAILNSNAGRKAEYLAWIKQAASAIAGINGEYPVNNAQIIIVPIGAKREAVPWGEVQRGGSAAAHFYVDSFRPIAEFKQDWTATHELSHMLVPYIDRDELWLSEGIASYYQNVARAKAGMISPETGWDKLLAGFKRGTRAAKRESLSHTSATMQLYWGGAAIYLMADHALRQRSNHQQSLATVLKQFNQCCRPSTRSWSGLRLMRKLDQLSQSQIFSELYQQQAQQRRFPDILPLLKQLNFDRLQRDNRVKLSAAAQTLMN